MHMIIPARRPSRQATPWLACVFACTLAAYSGGVSSAPAATRSQTGAEPPTRDAVLVASSDKKDNRGSGSGKGGPVAQPANTSGRLLASNCFQCHGTLGLGGFDNIRGKDADEVLEYLTKTASGDIMAAHAQGYTRAQLQLIIDYLKQ